MTLLLARSDILGSLDIPTALAALRAGFLESAAVEPLRIRTDLPGPGTATTLLPGLIPGIPAYTVKVNAKFPTASPALRGIVCLHDLSDGTLLAILDSTTITAWRTGLAAALATDLLALREADATEATAAGADVPDTAGASAAGAETDVPSAAGAGAAGMGAAGMGAGVVGVVGGGVQASMVVAGLSALRGVRQLVVCDLDPARAAQFLAQQRVPGITVSTPQDVVERANIVVLATWAREPLLTRRDVRPGLHLTALGADEPGKVELSAELLAAARVVVDDRGLAAQMGALGNVGLGMDAADATLTEVLTGVAPGRRTDDEVTVYAPVGLPWQDLAIAWPVYQAALASGRGQVVDFLS